MSGEGRRRGAEVGAEIAPFPHAAQERETDQHKVSKRRKQVEFGYNTAGYQRYTQLVPK